VIVDTLLILSVVSNVFMILYVRWLLRGLSDQSRQIEQSSEILVSFVEHVDSLHQIEMFYGDKSLQELIKHGKEVVSYFQDVDFLTDEDDEAKEESEEEMNENS
jgi:hypothetical protein